MKVVRVYNLLQIGCTYEEALNMPVNMNDCLLEFHKQLKEYEADEMDKQNKKIKGGRR